MTEPSGYVLQPLREGPDFTLYRGWQNGNTAPVLAIAAHRATSVASKSSPARA